MINPYHQILEELLEGLGTTLEEANANPILKAQILRQLLSYGVASGRPKSKVFKYIRETGFKFQDKPAREIYDSITNKRKTRENDFYASKLRKNVTPDIEKITLVRNAKDTIYRFMYIATIYLYDEEKAEEGEAERLPKNAIRLSTRSTYTDKGEYMIKGKELLNKEEVTELFHNSMTDNKFLFSKLSFVGSDWNNVANSDLDIVAYRYERTLRSY